MSETKQSRWLREGLTFHSAGKLARAEAAYRKVLDRVPGHPEAAYLLAEVAFANGRPAYARQLAERALAAQPAHSGALCLVGNIAFAVGNIEAARESWLQAVARSPTNAAAQVNLSLLLSDRQDVAGAERHARAALTADPAMMRAHYALGYALMLQGRFAEAEAAYHGAIAREPGNPAVLRELSVVLTELQRPEEALALQDAVRMLRPSEPGLEFACAVTLSRMGRQKEAEATYQIAAAVDGRGAAFWSARGQNLRVLGRFDEARCCFQRALEIEPDEAAARLGLADTGGLPEGTEQIAALRAIADDPARPDPDRIEACFALGRTLDSIGEPDGAFTAYHEGNTLQRRRLNAAGARFDAAVRWAHVEQLQRYWSAEAICATAASAIAAPSVVFVTGMPRSGTTLVEQIAASHPLVHGAGELNDVPAISSALFEGLAGGALLGSAKVRADAYRERLRILGGSAERVIDKQTSNVFHIGTIAALLPGARVILCRRDPRDASLSCFFQRFPGEEGEYTDLDDVTAVATMHTHAAEHWCALAPLPILVVGYEELVHDIEAGARRIIDFLNLEWDPACLRFHELDRPVATASAWQVRQPAYTSAVGRWRGYARHLPASLHALAAAGRR